MGIFTSKEETLPKTPIPTPEVHEISQGFLKIGADDIKNDPTSNPQSIVSNEGAAHKEKLSTPRTLLEIAFEAIEKQEKSQKRRNTLHNALGQTSFKATHADARNRIFNKAPVRKSGLTTKSTLFQSAPKPTKSSEANRISAGVKGRSN